MANNFPTSLNTHKKDWANTTPVKDTHPEEHNDIAGAVEALEAKVGVDNSEDHDSHDYKLSGITDDDRAASEADLGAHVEDTENPHSVTKSQVGLGNVDNTSDATKNSAAVTLTNKTIDADNNTITDLEVDNFKANVVDTDVTLAASSNSRIPSQNAVKVYVDEKAGGGNFPPKFGDARDGTVTISGTVTLTEDKYYNNLTVESGAILNTGGYRIYVAGTLTNNGTIRNNGGNGGNATHSTVGSPGTAGAAGTPAPGVTVAAPAASGAGGAGVTHTAAGGGEGPNGNNGGNGTAATDTSFTATGTGGNGGNATAGGGGSATGGSGGTPGASDNETFDFVTSPAINVDLTAGSEAEFFAIYHFVGSSSARLLSGASGTGGGGSGAVRLNQAGSIATSGAGGGAGGNGGIVYIVAKIIVNDGVIEAKGGNGGNGGNAANSGAWSVAGGGGTGAGGCGGAIFLAYADLSGAGTLSANGGESGLTVGTGVNSSGSYTAATRGTSGADGVIFKVKALTDITV